MANQSISLPEDLRAFVDEQVTAGGYGTANAYVEELIRQEQKRVEEERLEALLLEGLDSGPGIEVTPKFWEELRAELAERHRPAEGA